jgi:hypothetical protein
MREVYDVGRSLTMIKKYMLYTDEAAVILSALNVAQADAFIACWDAKYACIGRCGRLGLFGSRSTTRGVARLKDVNFAYD